MNEKVNEKVNSCTREEALATKLLETAEQWFTEYLDDGDFVLLLCARGYIEEITKMLPPAGARSEAMQAVAKRANDLLAKLSPFLNATE